VEALLVTHDNGEVLLDDEAHLEDRSRIVLDTMAHGEVLLSKELEEAHIQVHSENDSMKEEGVVLDCTMALGNEEVEAFSWNCLDDNEEEEVVVVVRNGHNVHFDSETLEEASRVSIHRRPRQQQGVAALSLSVDEAWWLVTRNESNAKRDCFKANNTRKQDTVDCEDQFFDIELSKERLLSCCALVVEMDLSAPAIIFNANQTQSTYK
jgi:hypothetical protein